MSPALRALIDADNRRPGPSDGVRAGVYAALGVSMVSRASGIGSSMGNKTGPLGAVRPF